MAKRSYNQNCSLAYTLDVIGERWTLLLIRELLTGPKRFTDLLNNLPGIGTNLLSARLKDLEEFGILVRMTLPPPAASAVYDLTEHGRDLQPALVELVRWGNKLARPPKGTEYSRPGWAILAMHAAFQPELATGLKETYEFRIGDEVFYARINDGTIDTGQGYAGKPDLVIVTDPQTFLKLASELPLEQAISSGAVHVEGDLTAVDRLSQVFELPTDCLRHPPSSSD